MLKGRLGLETARIPHKDRHGIMWLSRGKLSVNDGTLEFVTAGADELEAGQYGIPFQLLSCIVLQPGSTVTHDALRLMARHGTGLVAAGEGGVRMYASMPFGPDNSALARRQTKLWSDEECRLSVARRMYALRLGEVLPDRNINVLRGIEGARVKALYQRLAEQYGVQWAGRKYDRQNPESTNAVNQAINHAAVAVRSCAMVAVAATGAIPQLGFIHEDSGLAFSLDIADLFRDSVTIPSAFAALSQMNRNRWRVQDLERAVRKQCATTLTQKKVVSKMIDKIKQVLDEQECSE
ncbi:MAG: type I-E CRISPR-associated endonuclease Cas1e [Myxococcota bacterium]